MEPFAVPETLEVERANRLMAVKAMPGYVDIQRISAHLVRQATSQLIEFGGWDEKQIAILKARAQAATEHDKLLFRMVDEAIREGISEASQKKDLQSEKKTDIFHTVDRVRAESLTESPDDMRIAGSY